MESYKMFFAKRTVLCFFWQDIADFGDRVSSRDTPNHIHLGPFGLWLGVSGFRWSQKTPESCTIRRFSWNQREIYRYIIYIDIFLMRGGDLYENVYIIIPSQTVRKQLILTLYQNIIEITLQRKKSVYKSVESVLLCVLFVFSLCLSL